MRRIHLKDGVSLADLKPEMQTVLIVADEVYDRHGQEVVVTSHKDGGHSPQSKHYSGYALDLRTRYFDREQVPVVATDMRAALGDDYDVVVHGSHLHIEYDPSSVH